MIDKARRRRDMTGVAVIALIFVAGTLYVAWAEYCAVAVIALTAPLFGLLLAYCLFGRGLN
ncbi:MAG: hypothetical protein OXM56_06985 [Gammaproteobacteria bacterium]|nr:hypothetical protein [Gammaproteobacteria bacterium]